jgi:hypothetical protein
VPQKRRIHRLPQSGNKPQLPLEIMLGGRIKCPHMSGPRGAERSATGLGQSAALATGYSHVSFGPGGTQRVSERMTRELLRLGKNPDKMTRVEIFAATRLVSEGVVGVPRIGVPYSLTPVKTPSVRLAEIARQAMEIRTHIGAPGGNGKHGAGGPRVGVVGGIAAIGATSRHQQQVTATNIAIQAAAKTAQRPSVQVSL